MKVSYSKLLVQGVIATTLLMSMSCQKKGSARGVQPDTKTVVPKTTAPDASKNLQKDGLANLPEGADRAVVRPGAKPTSGDPTVAKTDIATGTSSDKTTVEPVTKKNKVTPTPAADEKEEKIAEGQPGSESNPIQLEEVVVTGKKTTPAANPAAAKACSEAVVKSETQVKALASKILEADKVSTTSDADRIANYTTYHQLCLDWAKNFETEKIQSCEIDAKVRDMNSFNHTCIKYALSLKDLTGKDNAISAKVTKARNERMAALRAAKLVVSDEAKEMFNKENTFWKMFIVDGELQTDSAKLTDAIKANKVVCTIAIASKDKYNHAQNVILSVSGATELESTDEADPVKTGVQLALRIKATDKDATAEDVAKAAEDKSVMLCSNLDNKNMNTAALAKTLGKHIAVAAPVAKEETKKEEKKEDAVKQK